MLKKHPNIVAYPIVINADAHKFGKNKHNEILSACNRSDAINPLGC